MWAPHVRVSALAPFLFPQFSTFLLSLSSPLCRATAGGEEVIRVRWERLAAVVATLEKGGGSRRLPTTWRWQEKGEHHRACDLRVAPSKRLERRARPMGEELGATSRGGVAIPGRGRDLRGGGVHPPHPPPASPPPSSSRSSSSSSSTSPSPTPSSPTSTPTTPPSTPPPPAPTPNAISSTASPTTGSPSSSSRLPTSSPSSSRPTMQLAEGYRRVCI
ncbi:Os04g0626300 [Oryza sativa Japonica Group]|uniref:Os04g0626300 protein n=1 Tax=Oryza sativa subsp. japonica TaxID=39947 RepID=A0A0P0WF10_ORYSJ|nr:Os04g0626300 [Oryza sativa Japonica Group]